MSAENVEIVKRASQFMEERDLGKLATVFDPEVELHGTVGGLEEGKVLRGFAEILAAFDAETEEAWAEHRIEPQEYIDAGDRVVILHREYQRSKSGVELEIDTASVHDVSDGRIVRMQGFMNPEEALRAVGLRD